MPLDMLVRRRDLRASPAKHFQTKICEAVWELKLIPGVHNYFSEE